MTAIATSAPLFGSSVATKPGVVKMPTPITFEMTMAAASSGPRRRSRGAEGLRVTRAAPVPCLRSSFAFGATTGFGDAAPRSLGDQTPLDLKCTDLLPLRRSVLREQIDFRVDELRVVKQLVPRVGTLVTELRPDGQGRGDLAGQQTFRAGDRQEAASPLLLRIGHTAEQRVHLEGGELLVRDVFQPERDGRHQLVLAVDEPGVEPPARNVEDLKSFAEIDRWSTAGRHQAEEQQAGRRAHSHILAARGLL